MVELSGPTMRQLFPESQGISESAEPSEDSTPPTAAQQEVQEAVNNLLGLTLDESSPTG